MFSFRRKVQDSVDALKDQGASVAEGAGEALSAAGAHISTLAELFGMEAAECAGRAVGKARILSLGVCLLLIGYVMLLAGGCLLLADIIGWPLSLGVIGGAHFLIGGILVLAALKRRVGPIAPATVQELKNDVQCIQLLLKKGNKNS